MKFETHLHNDKKNAPLLHPPNGVATDLHDIGARAFAIFEIVGVIHDPESVRVFQVDLDGEPIFNHRGADFRAVHAAMELPIHAHDTRIPGAQARQFVARAIARSRPGRDCYGHQGAEFARGGRVPGLKVLPSALPVAASEVPMLLDEIKTRMFKAMKEGRIVEKEILRVAVGEITTQAARAGSTGGDEEAQAIVRKLVKSNEETLALTEDAERRAALELENKTLGELLPKTLTVDEIVVLLQPAKDAIVAAGNDGQATGVAMKTLKASGAQVNGKDVSAAVRKIRG